MPTREGVRRSLGLDPSYDEWLDVLERLGPPPGGLVDRGPDQTRSLLERVGCTGDDLVEALATAPSPDQTALWWLLERAHHAVVRGLEPDGQPWSLPQLPDALGATGRFFPLHVLLSAVPALRAWHAARGIAADVTWATLQDLGRGAAIHRATSGVGGYAKAGWAALHFRGRLYQLGRLQYELMTVSRPLPAPMCWYDDAEAAQRGPGFRVGDPVLNVHVPATGPLTAEACDESLALARAFVDRHFPAPDRRLAVCVSWLLDDQLAEHLPPSSNIVAFQRRFTLVPGAVRDDHEPLRFVFRRVPDDLRGLPRETTLQRSLLDHLAAAGHWHVRTGWFLLAGP